MIPHRPAAPSSRNFCGWWAVLSFLPRLPWARLPRPAPLFPRSRFGQSPGGGDTGVPIAGAALRARGNPLPSPAPSSTPVLALPPPSPAASWWQSRDPGQTRVGRREGRESEVRVACSRRGTAGGPAASGRAPVLPRPGAPTRCAAAAGGRRAQLGAFRAAAGLCACARRGDGARAGRAAKATRRRGGGGGLGPDGDSRRRCCRRTGGDSRRD